MKKRILAGLVGLLLIALAGSSAESAYLPSISIEKLVHKAGKIVAGRCIQVTKGVHPQYGNIKVTFITIDVLDVIKGRKRKTLEFMQYGQGEIFDTVPYYKYGENILLFLYPESNDGFTSPVGGYQGKLRIIMDKVKARKPKLIEVKKGAMIDKIEYGKFKNRIKNLIKNKKEKKQ